MSTGKLQEAAVDVGARTGGATAVLSVAGQGGRHSGQTEGENMSIWRTIIIFAAFFLLAKFLTPLFIVGG